MWLQYAREHADPTHFPPPPKAHLTQVTHDLEVLHVNLITAVGADHARPLLGKRSNYVSAKEAGAPKDCGLDAADLYTNHTAEPWWQQRRHFG